MDRSDYRVDHLSSFAVISGLMHVCMNKMQSTGHNSWGTETDKDDVSNPLPNRTNVNMHKHDFYAWLRFLDVVLTITAAMCLLWTLNQHPLLPLRTYQQTNSSHYVSKLLTIISCHPLTASRQMASSLSRVTLYQDTQFY